jgi:hypothetical protein
MKITMEGKYQTRDGTPVRLLATDLKTTPRPVVGIVTDAQNYDSVLTWNLEGFLDEDGRHRPLDLVPALTKYGGWGVVNKQGELIAAFSDKASIRRDLFGGDSVVRLSWEN